jgi:two-component system, sensor histidine kinase
MPSLAEQAFQLISGCVLFRNLAHEEKQALFARMRIHDFAGGDSIFQEGSPGDSMMIVLYGKIEIGTILSGGRALSIAVMSPGDMFGEMAMLDGKERTANATAMTACSIAVLDRNDLLEFLELNPSAWRNIISVLCERLRRTDEQFVEINLLHDEIRNKNQILAEASQNKSRFLAVASHDLRQPLHALGLFVAQLRDHVSSTEGGLLIDRVDAAMATMNELFNALLDISKLDAGALTPTIANFPISSLFAKIDSTFATAAYQKGLSFRLHPDETAWVRSDPILLERIVFNLVSNAVRYTTRGGIVVGCRRRGTTLSIEVADSGPGIPEDQQRKIFSEFYRLADSAKTNQAGLGLGLAIVERLCVLLDNPIALASTPGKGSRFSVAVPMVSATERPKAETSPPAAIDVVRGKLVVVIDNDPGVLEGMGGLLRSWGCRVVMADSPDAALAELGAAQKPDLIISDFHLTNGQSGIAAIAQLRSVYGAVPAFLMSGDIAPDRLRESRDSGHHLLYKPVRPMTLRAMMSQLLKNGNAGSAP